MPFEHEQGVVDLRELVVRVRCAETFVFLSPH